MSRPRALRRNRMKGGRAMTEVAAGTGATKIGLEDVDIPRLGMAAMRFINAIEQGQHDTLWTAASDMMRGTMPKESFMGQLTHRHHVLGRGTARRWTAVRVDRPNPRSRWQPGTYAVVEFSVNFGSGRLPHRETVTLRHEDGGIWRLAGYAVKAA
ncbi:hypothetical protein J2X02_002286 [Pseudoxanthomonas japonensis]|uniref:DUF4019 domain-containing protein n=1 Tax=Pseudoxanthomonas japonensis TaxID=69284 RepID=UPI002860C7F1|nr:DUF4019 domain-containing protein [Pseudoxanthomonas japonensis]MDR7069435.1 hypothetical protein [Pseudoxanthomonas japonensis]